MSGAVDRSMTLRRFILVGAASLLVAVGVACSSSDSASDDTVSTGTDSGASSDAAVGDAAPVGDAGPVTPLSACPSSGIGAISDPDAFCGTVLPPATGADPAGANTNKVHYALRPNSGGDDVIVVFFNGSDGDPAHVITDPAKNVFTAAVAAGHHAIGLSYRSNQIVGQICFGRDACFLPTRTTIIKGVFQTGADNSLNDILPTEGIEERLRLLLVYLTSADPSGNWASFLTADHSGMDWTKIISSGHSQGGGHAALLGKLHAVPRIVTFSSPCDSIGNDPPVAATWEHADSSWATSPADKAYALSATTIYDGGTAVAGDTECPAHAAVWNALGLSAANQHDDAVVCVGAKSPHAASIGCSENYDTMKALYTTP
jgi:hypothetical protein